MFNKTYTFYLQNRRHFNENYENLPNDLMPNSRKAHFTCDERPKQFNPNTYNQSQMANEQMPNSFSSSHRSVGGFSKIATNQSEDKWDKNASDSINKEKRKLTR